MTDVPAEYKDVPGVFAYTILGRTMWFKPPGHGPLILMQKYRAQLINMARNNDPGYSRLVVDVTAKTLNVINGQFLNADDRDWVEELILTEQIQIPEVIAILSGGNVSKAEDDDTEVEVKPRKTAAKKAVKKTVANGKRTRA